MSKNIDKDDFLLKLLHAGDHQAMTVMFQEYAPMITKIIYRTVGDIDISKDITQDLFLEIWEKRNVLNIKKPIKAYLIRAAINEALYYLRSQRKKSSLRINQQEYPADWMQDANNQADRELTTNEMEAKIQKIIDTLPPKCKVVYQLSRDEEMTYHQIASHLNVSVKVVEKHISRALKSLREAFKTLLIIFIG